jgi:hypothetical protein
MDKEIPKRSNILTTLIVLTLLLFSFYFIANTITKYTGHIVMEKESEVECLENNSIELFINSPNPINDMEELKIKKYLGNVKVSNCLTNSKLCEKNNIGSYPTWIINNKKVLGDITPEYFAKTTGCELENIK